ncbi:MAG: hypothetical protein E5299_00953 [Burkholderia gladioli]|nr:MAG: hypothetical protein E5299_00953 [Burkholderia gladioli]
MPMDSVFFQNSVETLGGAVDLWFGGQGVPLRHAPAFDLVAEVVRRVVRAIIHSHRQSAVGVGFDQTIELGTPPDRGKWGDIAEPGKSSALVYPFQSKGFAYHGDRVAHVDDFWKIQGQRAYRSRSMHRISISTFRSQTRCTATWRLMTSNQSSWLGCRLAAMLAKVSSRHGLSSASVATTSRETTSADLPHSRRGMTARLRPKTDHCLHSTPPAELPAGPSSAASQTLLG